MSSTKKTARRQSSGLTPRQARFVKEYLVDMNGTQAAIRAGYSAHTANKQSTRLLTNADIKAAVEAGAAKQHAQLDLTAQKVLTELLGVGYAEVATSNIKVGDKLRTLELLAKHLGLLTEQVNVTLVADRDRLLEAGRQRNAEAARHDREDVNAQAATTDFEQRLTEEVASCYGDPLRFVRTMYPWGEPNTFLAHATGPDVWQAEFLTRLGAAVRQRQFDGVTAVQPIRMAVSSGHGIGKSTLVAWIVDWIMSTRTNSRGTITANTFTQVQDKTWAAIRKWTPLCLTGPGLR